MAKRASSLQISRGFLKVIRDAKIVAASGRSAAMSAFEFRFIDQSLIPLLITEMEPLGYNVAQVVRMHPCLALCIVDLCLYIRHERTSL